MKTEIGKNIKFRRKALKITQTELSDLAGISINTLYKIERGQANPTLNILEKIAVILGMEVRVSVNVN